MNKKAMGLLTLSLFAAMGLAACTPKEPTPNPDSSKSQTQGSAIRLRSAAEQKLKVGESMTIVYSLNAGYEKETVLFSSDNESVLSVSEYGDVLAMGEGEATVTLALKSDASNKVSVHFVVTKTFFIQTSGLYNGNIDFADEDNGVVKATGGQVQMLVNFKGQNWYFKCHITKTGYVNSDPWGRYGVGSFLVDKSHPIGDTMFWYGFNRLSNDYADTDASPYFGGWRYETGVTNKETSIDPTRFDFSEGVDVTILRKGAEHYFMFEGKKEKKTVKYAYSVNLFEGKDTYPGIYSQNQQLTITDFKAGDDAEFLNQKYNEFQSAESVKLNALDSRLENGHTYDLTSTVEPEVTPNKGVVYSLYEEKEGVTLTSEGKLTIAEGVTGSFRVVTAWKEDGSIKSTTKLTAVNKTTSSSPLFETGEVVNEAGVTLDDENKKLTFNGQTSYVPLVTPESDYLLTYEVEAASAGKVGALFANKGYMQRLSVATDFAKEGNTFVSEELLGTSGSVLYRDAKLGTRNEKIQLAKIGSTFHLFENGRFLKSFQGSNLDDAMPVLYGDGYSGSLTNLRVEGASAAKALLEASPYYVGGYVESDAEGTYKLSDHVFSSDLANWPPENAFSNGLKSAKTFKGHQRFAFTLSDMKPVEAEKLDSKFLVYLRSESVTSSIQLVVKGTKDAPTYALCPNFDDATWKEYPLAEYNIDFSKPTSWVIDKTIDGVTITINGVAVMAGDKALKNEYKWTDSTLCTPGLGTFKMAVTLSAVTMEEVHE